MNIITAQFLDLSLNYDIQSNISKDIEELLNYFINQIPKKNYQLWTKNLSQSQLNNITIYFKRNGENIVYSIKNKYHPNIFIDHTDLLQIVNHYLSSLSSSSSVSSLSS